MKLLPYFKWYPGDAEGDDFYSLTLTNEELGIYHRLLNRSWMNDGITSDLDVLAAFSRLSRDRFDEVWKKISKRWVVSERDESKLVNPRQEAERASAKLKSENNKRDGNANAKGTRKERAANGLIRAYGSGSPALSVVPSKKEAGKSAPMSQRFNEFWGKHPGKKLRIDLCAAVWAHTVTTENETGVFTCLDNYLESAEVSRGAFMDPEKWLSEVVAGGCIATWPKAREPTRKEGMAEQVARQIQENLARGEEAW